MYFRVRVGCQRGCPKTVVSGSQVMQPWQEEERRRDTSCMYHRVRLGCR